MDAVRGLIRERQKILVFTGAGISTGSGIADFRGPQGIWKKRRPVQFEDFLHNESARLEHWDYKLEGWQSFQEARPNAAHLALLELERSGRLLLLVTQNVDGLHHLAGHSEEKVVELNCTNRLVECLQCGMRSEPTWAFEYFQRRRRCPMCEECGGLVKTATISFGQPMPEDLLRRSFQAASECDLVLALGSTLSVQPAATVASRAARLSPYIIINQGATEHDHLATHRLSGDLTRLLPGLID